MKSVITAAALCLAVALTGCNSTQDVAPAALGADGQCPAASECCSGEAVTTEFGAVSETECSGAKSECSGAKSECSGQPANLGAVSDAPSCGSAAPSCSSAAGAGASLGAVSEKPSCCPSKK